MPAPVSVVIPTLEAAGTLSALLEDLAEGAAAGLVGEVVVSDGGSRDATGTIARRAGAQVVVGPPGRGGQLRRGCAVACGAWLMVLHADSRLPPGWTGAVAQALARPDRAHAFRLAFRAHGAGARLTAGWANLRTRLFGLPYGDQGLLLARPLYDAAGGYPDIPLMEDVALVRALPRRPRLMGATLTTGAERYLAEGWVRRGARNLGTLARYRLGVPPERLAARYGPRR